MVFSLSLSLSLVNSLSFRKFSNIVLFLRGKICKMEKGNVYFVIFFFFFKQYRFRNVE